MCISSRISQVSHPLVMKSENSFFFFNLCASPVVVVCIYAVVGLLMLKVSVNLFFIKQSGIVEDSLINISLYTSHGDPLV